MTTAPDTHLRQLAKFWWVFAVRGGSAVLFAAALAFTSGLLGTLFFDPVLLVFLSLLLGVFVLGNGILLGVAAGFAAEQRLPIRFVLAAESLFAVALGIYIGLTLRIDPQTLATLAGLAAAGAGCFQFIMAFRARQLRFDLVLLTAGGTLSLLAGALFLLHRNAPVRATGQWLSLFELLIGAMWLTFAYTLHTRALQQTAS